MAVPTATEIAERLATRPVSRWHAKDGRVVALADMTPAHRRNLKAFLERNAELYQQADFIVRSDCFTPYTGSGEMAEYYAGNEFPMLGDATPREWLRSQPFYRALQKLVRKDPLTLKEEA